MKRILMATAAALMMGCEETRQMTDYCFDEMTYTPEKTVFKLFAPAEAQCIVVLGDHETHGMEFGSDSIWKVTVPGDQKGKKYHFLLYGQGTPGVFAKAVMVNGKEGVVVDMRETDPEGWADDHGVRPERYADWVVYEMHHRDFSVNRPEAVNKGKFLALTEPWAIEHLLQLGVTAVHILPSYDFGSVDETRLDEPQYNWGYDPVNYNVPEGSYSTNPADPLCRIREFKQMVQALHKAGIAVVLDVVYNHTYGLDHSNFQRTYPDYFYRGKEKAVKHDHWPLYPDHAPTPPPSIYTYYFNGSGCGNETASEKPMMRRFMIESVKYWIQEYHIDGFRFDLMGCHDIETMNQIRQAVDEIDPRILIYGEGWSAGECGLPTEQLAVKANIRQMPRIAAFSDDLRDALRGPFSDDAKGAFLAGLPGEEMSIMAGIAGMVEHPQVDYARVNYSDEPYAQEPTQMMAYVSCHDDMCLVDRLMNSAISQPGKKRLDKLSGSQLAELVRLDLLAQTAVFTSQGVPFMLSGEELLRTKLGVHNSFESPDSVNQLDWTGKERYPQVFDYYRRLIALRRHHPAFRLGKADLVRQHLEFLPGQECLVAFRLKDHAGGDEWGDIIVVLNANRKAMKVDVPEGSYTVVCREGKIDEQGLGTVSGRTVSVAPQSALIMYKQ